MLQSTANRLRGNPIDWCTLAEERLHERAALLKIKVKEIRGKDGKDKRQRKKGLTRGSLIVCGNFPGINYMSLYI